MHILNTGDLNQMTSQVVLQLHKYSQIGTKPWTYETALKDLPVEVGSLMKLAMQLHNERYAHGLSETELKLKMADELADILSMILFIAHDLNLDLTAAWEAMLESDDHKIATRKHLKG